MQTRQKLEEARQITEQQQLPPTATVGGFPWSFLLSVKRHGWLSEIKEQHFPDESLSAWTAFIKLADEIAERYIDVDIHRMLDDFARAKTDAIVIDNLPVDPSLEQTPSDGNRPTQKKAISEMVIAGLINRMRRQIISYRQEKRGAAFHQLVPIAGEEARQSNTGRTKFGYHTDNANLPIRFRQEGLALYGLRNEMNVATLIITIDDIKQQVSPDIISNLRFPIYRFPHPLSFEFGGWNTLSETRPIISTDDDGIDHIALPRSEFAQLDVEADTAVKAFRIALDHMIPRRVILTPGRFLAFNNSRALHGRDTVVGDRWIQRVYFSPSLEPQRAATNSDEREFCFDARLFMMQ